MNLDEKKRLYAVFLAALIDPSKHRSKLTGPLLEVLDLWKAAEKPEDWLHRELLLGALLFRRGLYFEAHEYLEAAWKDAPEEGWKQAVQGVIQIAAGFHKREHDGGGKSPGADYLFERGLAKVRAHAGLLGELAAELEGAVDHARKA